MKVQDIQVGILKLSSFLFLGMNRLTCSRTCFSNTSDSRILSNERWQRRSQRHRAKASPAAPITAAVSYREIAAQCRARVLEAHSLRTPHTHAANKRTMLIDRQTLTV